MDSKTHPADLDQCVAALPDDQRRALRQYWEQVIREEWVPVPERRRRAVSLAELDERRERREARRAIALVARAVQRPVAVEPVAYGPEAA